MKTAIPSSAILRAFALCGPALFAASCASAPAPKPATVQAAPATVVRARPPLFSVSYDAKGSPSVLTTQAPTVTLLPSGLFRVTFDPVPARAAPTP